MIVERNIPIHDDFRIARGNWSRIYSIRCAACDRLVCYYQKDGGGKLKRLYIDRIFSPTVPVGRKIFRCPVHHELGIRVLYAKESRASVRLFVDAITKETTSVDDYLKSRAAGQR